MPILRLYDRAGMLSSGGPSRELSGRGGRSQGSRVVHATRTRGRVPLPVSSLLRGQEAKHAAEIWHIRRDTESVSGAMPRAAGAGAGALDARIPRARTTPRRLGGRALAGTTALCPGVHVCLLW